MTRTILWAALLVCACDPGTRSEARTEIKTETKVETRPDSGEMAPVDAKTAAVTPTAPDNAKTVAVADHQPAGRDARTADKAAQTAAVGDASKAGDRIKNPEPTPPATPDAGGTSAQKDGWATYESYSWASALKEVI